MAGGPASRKSKTRGRDMLEFLNIDVAGMNMNTVKLEPWTDVSQLQVQQPQTDTKKDDRAWK